MVGVVGATTVSGQAVSSVLSALAVACDLPAEHHLGQVLDVDLMHDAGTRRHHLELVEAVCPQRRNWYRSRLRSYSSSTLPAKASGPPNRSATTEWSMTSSAGASGLILAGSPPNSATASPLVARSTTAGTPVKSCMITRAGLNWIAVFGSAFGF